MCGISGWIGPDSASVVANALAMAEALRHRGPDDFGTWSAGFSLRREAQRVAFGHNRLSILDLSSLGHQPMAARQGKAVLSFNGEVYNFKALRQELRQLGHEFRSENDAEVLLAAFLSWGEGAFERLHGMFAFALWDEVQRALYLVRDRLGIKPLYYGTVGGGLAFASELGALRAHPAFRAAIDRAALGRYLRFGYVSGPETIYQDIHRLMPGQWLCWREGRLKTASFWDLCAPVEEPPSTFAGAVDRLEELLLTSVEERLMADVPLGAFLSGGIDSSAVVSLMAAQAKGRVRTYSIGFHEDSYNEAPLARAVARHLGTEHRELMVGRGEAADVVRDLPTLFDEPFGDASAIPTVLVSRLARQEVSVVLSGDGGDELFGGYSRYRRLLDLEGFFRLPHLLRRAVAKVGVALPGARGVGRTLALLAQPGPGWAAEAITSRFAPGPIAACCGPAAADPRESFLSGYGRAPARSSARRMMYGDVASYLVDDILVKLDRASMSVGLEARVPILDHRLVRFALSLPTEYLWRDGHGKAPLRALLTRRVPKELVDRPKKGFGFPVAALLGPELDQWTERYLAPERLAEEGNLRPEGVRRLLAATDRSSRLGNKGLWYLLCFQRWFAHVHRGEAD